MAPTASTAPTAPPPPAAEAIRFADQLERSFRGGAWHGPSVIEALEGVTAAAADRRPIAGGHSIRELVFHIDFWLEAARCRIEGVTADGANSDWPAADGGGAPAAEADWQAARARLEATHRRLHATVLALAAERFDQKVAGSDPTLRGMLFGLLQHTAYHGGQIVLLARGT